MTIQTRTAENGVNVAALLGAREALSQAPQAARFKWRATSKWLKGAHSRATVEGFFGLGGEQAHRQPYHFDSDHPEIFAAEDNGATPVELVLVALAGCLTAGVAAVAQRRNIQLKSVQATLEAPMDLQGILGIDPDASAEEIAALVAQSQKRSAVFDVVTNPTEVLVTTSKI